MSSSNNGDSHAPIYTQDDMDVILAQLRNAQKDAEQSKQLLWAVVDQVGGEIAIHFTAWLDGDLTKQLVMWDDNLQLHLKAVTDVERV